MSGRRFRPTGGLVAASTSSIRRDGRARPLLLVFLATTLICAAIVVWALAGPLSGARPVGDGRNPATYGFDLTATDFRGGALAASGHPRDFLVAMDEPRAVAGIEMAAINRRERGKQLVTTDRVVGIVIGGEARAYPVTLLNAHEVVNDLLGNVPIAVTFSPLADAPVVIDRRRADRIAQFAVSGLLLDSSLLVYDRQEPGGPQSLYSPLRARAVSGPASVDGETLDVIPGVQLVAWREWLLAHPHTTVVLRDRGSARRYRQISYRRYLDGRAPIMPTGVAWPDQGPDDGRIGPMERIITVTAGAMTRAWTHSALGRAAGSGGRITVNVGDVMLELLPDAETRTVRVDAPTEVRVGHGLWFALHAADPTLRPERSVSPASSSATVPRRGAE